MRALEGLAPRTGVAAGALPADVTIVEDGIAYASTSSAGQKTGFYLDQRDNRALVRALAAGRAVLNVFCYTGGFTLAALAGGAARVLSIDSSADALAGARRTSRSTGARRRTRGVAGGRRVRRAAQAARRRARSFDLIVLDPPKFAPTAAHAERAARAYKDINLLGAEAAAPRRAARDVLVLGRRSTPSCSRRSSPARRWMRGGRGDRRALRAGRRPPVALAFPEGDYLKGLLMRKTA